MKKSTKTIKLVKEIKPKKTAKVRKTRANNPRPLKFLRRSLQECDDCLSVL